VISNLTTFSPGQAPATENYLQFNWSSLYKKITFESSSYKIILANGEKKIVLIF
jgi:hypothetical protein